MRTLSRFIFMPLLCAMAIVATSCSKDETKEGGNSGATRGTVGGHEWVDLGLPSGTKWATCNVGATNPEDYGEYFAWGETVTKSKYSSDNSKWCKVEYSDLKAQGVIDANGNLTAGYDVATVKWEGDWRMPTRDEIKELSTLDKVMVDVNGIRGIKLIGNNGNSLFLPFAYEFLDKYPDTNYIEIGRYWSSTAKGGVNHAYLLHFSDRSFEDDRDFRGAGHTVRPVLRTK